MTHPSIPSLIFLLATLVTGFVGDEPRILIIGDSISIGYTPYVQEQLTGQAVVMHNPGNAQHTGTGLLKVQEWVGDGPWDLVLFNWGLWDLCYRHPDSKVQGNRDKVNGTLTLSVEAYAANLDAIVEKLKNSTDAKLVFVTTSYVPENEAGRFQEDALRYNQAAKEVMERHSIAVFDIYEDSKRIHANYGKGSDDVHYMEEGYERLGKVLAAWLQAEITALREK